MKLGIIGCGSIGKRHARNALALGCEVIVTDTDPSQLRGLHTDILTSDDWPEADAYVIATPATTHLAMAAKCHGKPVLIEKPLAPSGPLGTLPPHAVVGYNLRFLPIIDTLVGVPCDYGQFWCLTNRSTWPGTSYGDTLSECSHEIDLALYTMGPMNVTNASCTRYWIIELRHASHTCDVVISDGETRHDRQGFLIRGGQVIRQYYVPPTVDQTYIDEMDAFLRFAETGVRDPRLCSVEEGAAVVDIIDEARARAICR